MAIRAKVLHGSHSHHSNNSNNFGTTATIITAITQTTTNITKSGYIIADFIFHAILSIFSI
jgi:hypothetical protein